MGRRPPLDAGDLVKITVPHSTVRRINTANFGPRPYRVEQVVTDSSGLKCYRVAGQLFLRHELLKVRDVQRNGETLESLKWVTEEDLDKECGGRRGRLGRALPGEHGDVTQYSMMLQRVRGKQQPQVEVRECIDEDNEPLALPKSNFEKLRETWRRSERPPPSEPSTARLAQGTARNTTPMPRPCTENSYRWHQVWPKKMEGADRAGVGCAITEATRRNGSRTKASVRRQRGSKK